MAKRNNYYNILSFRRWQDAGECYFFSTDINTIAVVYIHAEPNYYIYLLYAIQHSTDGNTASYSSLSGIIIAEKGTRFGFTTKKINKETTPEKLSDDFQMVEIAKRCGMVYSIVDKTEVKDVLRRIISSYEKNN